MDEKSKKVYYDQYKSDMKVYHTQMSKYFSSPSYRQYQIANHQIEQKIEKTENLTYLSQQEQKKGHVDSQYFTESSFDYLGVKFLVF